MKSFLANNNDISSSNETFSNIAAEYIKSLNNLECENQPLVIAFSGMPGMGKTTVAKILEEKFHAIRISSDEIRNLLRSHDLYPAKLNSKTDYLLLEKSIDSILELLEKTSNNHMLILDKSIDRDYQMIAEIARQNNYPLFTIRLELAKEEIIERLKSKPNPESYLKFFDKWYSDYQNFDVSKSNYFLNTSSPFDEKNLEDLFEKITMILNQK